MPGSTVEATAQDERVLDSRVAKRAREGDEEAFAELYRRHFEGIHDFVARTVRNRELAAEVVQATFVKAWEALRGGAEVEHVKAWLYAIARNRAIDEVRRRGREVPQGAGTGEESELGVFDRPDERRSASPEAAVEDHELAELVWAAARGLGPDDYSLLDMHLRRDLDADAIAGALDLRKGAVYTRLSRMKGALEDSLAALLLVRRGRDDCPELGELVRSARGGLDLELRRAVSRHARECERCGERRKRMAAPAEVLGALAPVPALPGVEEAVWAAVSAVGQGAGAGAGAAAEGGGWLKGAVSGTKLKAVGGVAVLAAIVSAVLLLGGNAVADPDDVRSTSHRVGVPSAERVMTLSWTPSTDASGYSIVWARDPASLPDEVADLPGDAAGVTSPRLSPGRWYFVLRTRGQDGEWTSTVHAGPYLIRTQERSDPRDPEGERRNRRDGDGAAAPTQGPVPGSAPGAPAPGPTSSGSPPPDNEPQEQTEPPTQPQQQQEPPQIQPAPQGPQIVLP